MLVLLGEASYTIYLLHQPVWAWMDRWLPAAPDNALTALCAIVASFVLASVCAVLSLRLLETPARQAIRARWDAPHQGKTQQGVSQVPVERYA
jgi:peptidoglycan/LPS O-acetylase OafA/YrhL